MVILKGSEDYSFIHVESYGYVTSYAPRQACILAQMGDCFKFLKMTKKITKSATIWLFSGTQKFIKATFFLGSECNLVPRLSKGEHHHFIWLRPGSETEVYIPIAIHVEQGSVDVTLELSTQMLQKTQELTINILPEGRATRSGDFSPKNAKIFGLLSPQFANVLCYFSPNC